MEQDQEGGLSLFLVFGIIVIGAIALFTRIREARRARKEDTASSSSEDQGKPGA
jgi:hypothetical protein